MFKLNHYDHGNGVAVADVDNDELLDIYFVSQVGPGALYKNLGNGKFRDITRGSGLEDITNKTIISVSFADIDNDGDSDVYLTSVKDGNLLFENDGTGKFKDISESSKTNHHGHSSASIFFDYNLDGLLDLFVANVGVYTEDNVSKFMLNGKEHEYYVGIVNSIFGHLDPTLFEQSVFYKNEGDNVFNDVTKEMGLTSLSWSGDASFLDANEDGYPDIYLTNMQGNDVYYENQGGKKFLDKSRTLFPMTPYGSMGIKVFDFDNNGSQDLYLTDMHSDMFMIFESDAEKEKYKLETTKPPALVNTGGKSIFGNAFYRKNSKNNFEEISDKINVENYWPWGVSVADVNADGFEDMFITSSMNYGYRYHNNTLMLNNKGKRFADVEFLVGIEPRRDGRYAKPWFDLDCSGKDKDHLECQNLKGKTTVWGSLGSRSSVIFDVEGDGDLDIITNEYNDHPMVLMSNLSDREEGVRFIKIKLKGTKSNRNGIGAIVTVTSPSGQQHKVQDGKSGYLSQSDYPLYFGLGDDDKIVKINVQWPSGIKQEVTKNLEINKLLTITESS